MFAEEFSEELGKAADIKDTHQELVRLIDSFIVKTEHYHHGLILQESVTQIQTSDRLTSDSMKEDLKQLKDQVCQYQMYTMDFAGDKHISPMH